MYGLWAYYYSRFSGWCWQRRLDGGGAGLELLALAATGEMLSLHHSGNQLHHVVRLKEVFLALEPWLRPHLKSSSSESGECGKLVMPDGARASTSVVLRKWEETLMPRALWNR